MCETGLGFYFFSVSVLFDLLVLLNNFDAGLWYAALGAF